MDYKSTLNLPKTDFPMKADLPNREPLLLRKWQGEDIYKLILRKTAAGSKYILHDGPPYANGNIHIGHALNKTLKDIIVKYKAMRGFNSAYVPGWDCHGLPVEHQLFKELKINKYQIAQVDFRKKAYDYALKYVAIQKEEFRRLGIFGEWSHPYLTLDKDYEESIVGSFNALVKKGYVYRGLKPVNWCYRCETALAEAEVEYENHTSPSIFVKFKLDETGDFGKESYLVIWTTTPWTLIANVAVAVHPRFVYHYVKTDKGNLIIAKDLLPNVLSLSGIEKYEVLKEVKGKDLEGLNYVHPFGLRNGRVVLADYVSSEEGSGLVHTAPGHGNEDYFTGIKYKLDIVMPVDSKGNFDAGAGEFKGLSVHDANKPILEKLQGLGALLWSGQIQHSYPHCWRCKNPVIFRATRQWFLNIDFREEGAKDTLRQRLLETIKRDIVWIPGSGKERISGMVELRPDWCLSRQRYWGVPIPALACNSCKEEFLEPAVIEKFAKFTKEEGSDCWFQRDVKDFLPAGLKCPRCGKADFSKGSDILDVWFDSGVSHQAVLNKREELGGSPAELYLEGSDQHRGWFQSSLIPSMCIDGHPPFKAVLTHGFVVDGEGKKMSKSQGNVIAPQDIIKNYGADILRLWVASSDYNEDIRISKEILTRLSEGYRKIRNTVRFILSNIYDFNPDTDKAGEDDLKNIDRWILREANVLLQNAEKAYDSFVFHQAYKLIYDFCNQDLSMGYLDMVKGRLYTTYPPDSKERRAAQTAIYELLSILVRLMAPILAFTAEEIWENMPKEKKDVSAVSVHALDLPQPENIEITKEMADFDSGVMLCRPYVAKALEEKRAAGLIGSSFDAKIKLLTNNEERYTFLSSLEGDLCEIFKVSQVEVKRQDDLDKDFAVEVDKADGIKCERCWNYSRPAETEKAGPYICARCAKAMGG
ncbi:MAG: isoleucine--tRNA ligase [Candidatus Omnitrophica bacterium]|nr:isoleucine--tRNA ligase [Candidatus Omnitrophota bacterium]